MFASAQPKAEQWLQYIEVQATPTRAMTHCVLINDDGSYIHETVEEAQPGRVWERKRAVKQFTGEEMQRMRQVVEQESFKKLKVRGLPQRPLFEKTLERITLRVARPEIGEQELQFGRLDGRPETPDELKQLRAALAPVLAERLDEKSSVDKACTELWRTKPDPRRRRLPKS